jgi:hypothetical protein
MRFPVGDKHNAVNALWCEVELSAWLPSFLQTQTKARVSVGNSDDYLAEQFMT